MPRPDPDRRRDRGLGAYGKKPRADGRWQGYVTLASGRRRYVVERTEAAMKAGVDALVRQQAEGRDPPTRDLTLGAFLYDWITRRRAGTLGAKALRPSTAIRYEILVRVNIAPEIGRVGLRRLRPDDVDRLLDALRRRGVGARTILHAYRLLHVALKHAERRGYVVRNPCDLVDPPQVAPTAPRELDERDIARVLKAAGGHRDEAVLWVAISTGVRRGELFALRWPDLDLDAGRVDVREQVQRLPGVGQVRSEPKSRAGVRTLALTRVAVTALRAHRKRQVESGRPNPLDLVFPSRTGTHVEPQNWNRDVWRPWLKAAKLPPSTKLRDLTRKAHSSLLVSLGVDPETLRRRMGHARADVTFQHYVQSLASSDEAAAEALDRALRKLVAEG